MKPNLVLTLLACLAGSLTAVAESPAPPNSVPLMSAPMPARPANPAKAKKLKRGPNNIEMLKTATAARLHPAQESNWEFRADVLGGIASSSQVPNSPLAFGGNFEARYKEYLGIGVDGTATLPKSAANGSYSGLTQRNFAAVGAANVAGYYPFYLAGFKVVPKLGVSYGVIHYEEVDTTVVGSDASSNMLSFTASGALATGGLAIYPIPKLEIFADYCTSLFLSGNANVQTSGGLDQTSALQGSKYSRIRAGVFYSIMPHTRIGSEYLTADFPGNSLSQKQILGAIGFDF